MAQSVLVASIITGARRRADYENNNHVTDAELLTYVNQAWKRLYALYVKAWPEAFRAEQTVTTTGGASYALPADHFATIGVDWRESSDTYIALRLLHEAERNRFTGITGASFACAYRVLGSNLVLYPSPPSGQTYRHVYLPAASELTGSNNTIDCRLGHEELIELLVARRILEKEDSYDGRWESQLDKFERDIAEEADMRSLMEPHQMFSVDLDNYDAADYVRRRWR